MSLSFLSKKSWHTAKHQNVEAVWVAEEKKKAEDQKVAELQKQLKEEREREELAKITGEDRGDTALNWMYSGGVRGSAADKEREEKEAQEFLLGKEYVSKSNDGNNVIAGSLADAVTVKSLNGTNEKNEYFAKRHEDPMFLIMQERQKEREKIEKYPAQMQRLSEQLSSPVTKKNKKEKKRKKKSTSGYETCSNRSPNCAKEWPKWSNESERNERNFYACGGAIWTFSERIKERSAILKPF